MDRITLGRMQNPVRGFLHGAAAVASLAGTAWLLARTWGDVPKAVSMLIFGASLVALYTTSALYHAVPWRDAWKQRMQRLDHSMIFVLVAGTYTPLAVNVLSGRMRVLVLSVVWAIALIGIAQRWLVRIGVNWPSITLQTAMGWFALVPLPELARRLSGAALTLTLLGGLAYTVGMVLLTTKRPRLFPRIFSYHEVFHVLVVVGSTAHFILIARYVAG